MKVLPANLDDFNDIEKIGNEFYFRNDGDDIKTIDVVNNVNASASNTPQTTLPADIPHFPIQLNEGVDASNNNANHEFDSSNNALREARSTLGYDQMQNGKKVFTVNHPNTDSMPITSPTISTKSQDNTDIWENEFLPPHTNIFEAVTLDDSDNILFSDTQLNGKIQAENIQNANVVSELSVININRADIEHEVDYDSFEDYSIEVDGPKILRKNHMRLHTSYQKTAIRQPLLQQGFILSPGYPKYYINMNCSWRISVPSGQRIRLILLDVHLRCNFCFYCCCCCSSRVCPMHFNEIHFFLFSDDPICKDYLLVFDSGSKKVLFQNCTEVIEPMEILSDTNEIKVILTFCP